MKALRIEKYGLENLLLAQIEPPPLGAGEVRVRVDAAGVNPSDVGIALGRFPTAVLPRTLGRDYAGRLVDGPAELVGKDVWGSGGSELGLTRDGAHAESLTLPASAVALRAPHLCAEGAAAMGVPFVTAWSALVDLGELKAGQWAIVSGAAGAVGLAAVQIAKALGAHAVGLVKEGTDLGPLEAAGVDAVAFSERNDLAAVVRAASGGSLAQVALNAVGAPVFAPMLEALAIGGRMTIFSAAGGREVSLDLFDFYRGEYRLLGLDTAKLSLAQTAGVLAKLNPLIESRALVPPPIAQRYPLERARDAYERVNAGGAGKVVIVTGGA